MLPSGDLSEDAVMVHFHPHALERLSERGATEEEVRATILEGETFSAKYGRTGFRRISVSTLLAGAALRDEAGRSVRRA